MNTIAYSKFVLAVLVATASSTMPVQSAPANATNNFQGTPVAANGSVGSVPIARARYHDLTSKLNGQTYRIMVAMPLQADPAKNLPAIFVLDGNAYFGSAAEVLTRFQRNAIATPAILFAIGYPGDDADDIERRRALDLTISPSKEEKDAGKFGGADRFLRVLEEEIKPFIAAHYKVDPANLAIWGHSYAGLAVLRSMLRNPGAFATYAVSSPSIWWNDREILRDEEKFSAAVRAGDVSLRLLVTSGGDEQPRGDGPEAKRRAPFRQIDNASELAARLVALNPAKVKVARVIFDGEVHISVSFASLSRAMRFAFPVD